MKIQDHIRRNVAPFITTPEPKPIRRYADKVEDLKKRLNLTKKRKKKRR